jgi:epsilon-lactone hydrolase
LEVKKIGGEEMASQQSQANKMHWEAIAANAGQPTTPEAVIEYNEIHWPGLTAEPGGVDYIETGAEGVPAIWVAPKGAMDDRVIFYSHGGGFISGSIYTHRKLVVWRCETNCRVSGRDEG